MMNRPVLVYADASGRIIDWPKLEMAGGSGFRWHRLEPEDWIPLPEGSELFLLPSRFPIGYSREKRRFEILERDPYDPSQSVKAVAAFVSPAHTQTYFPAYKASPGAPLLPLFAYTAVGWHKGRFVTAATRVDPDDRQDFRNFDLKLIRRNARNRMKREGSNRLIQHLGKCALYYGCPAARNLFMRRWEAPLPTSPVCNARCLGCISLQTRQDLCANQERIRFVPTPEEILAVAVPHLEAAPRAVVSFGQGCEGEPLLQQEVLRKAIKGMRLTTGRGTINVNSNGSLPRAVEKLFRAGLDSIRVSLNSCRSHCYHAYFKPQGYDFLDVMASLKTAKKSGGFVSLNYFVLPGFTDQKREFEALCRLLDEIPVDLIQMRNLNIDPDWYLRSMPVEGDTDAMGIRNLMQTLNERYPGTRLGYFNPCLDPGAATERTSHEKHV